MGYAARARRSREEQAQTATATRCPARRYLSTPAAILRPSAMAHTISEAPRLTSPPANTPSTLVMYFSATATLPRASYFTPRLSSSPFFTGPVKPIASRTRSTSISNSVLGMGMNRPFSNVTRCACSLVTWLLRPLNWVVETLHWRSQPSSCACEERSCIGQSGQGGGSPRVGGGSGGRPHSGTPREAWRGVGAPQTPPGAPPPPVAT